MFLDSSVLVELLINDPDSNTTERALSLIGKGPVYISVLQLGEISDWCYGNEIEPEEVTGKIKEIANVCPVTENICLTGSALKREFRESGIDNFSLMDGMILASARAHGQELLTRDTDFRKAEDATLI